MTPRVLLVCQPTDGGVALHVETLARRLPEAGVAVTVACPPGPWARALAADGVAVVEVPMVRAIAPRTDLGALARLRAEIGAGGYDLVHTHSAKAGVVGRLAARSHGVTTVHTPHAWSFLAAGGRLTSLLYRRIERALAGSTAMIICVSDGERRRGLQVADAARMTVVTNGVAVPDGAPRGAGHGARGEREVVVGTVARLAPQKGIGHLLEAFALVRAERDDVRLAIAGDGPLRFDLEADARWLGIADHVTFVGGVASPWSFLAGLDLFVLPSLWEGLPYALLEAMATGLPSVATAVDGVAEAIPDRRYGTVVAPGDSRRLAREILALVGDPQARADMGRLARRHVRETFSVDGMVGATADVYHRVLGDPVAARDQRPALSAAG
ncbi:MAG TPA: glycosyltransferase family 4 protein [Euzebyales bacterium]|nr:glycosyltransferase family 4 protein [Euzebyales bacterium]